MIRAAALAAVLVVLGGCDAPAQADTSKGQAVETVSIKNANGWHAGVVSVWHDEKRAVTCWIIETGRAGGISCIPDWQLAHDGDGLVVMPEADQ